MSALRGTAGRLPMTTFTFGLAGVTLMGLPPSGGFIGKWLLLTAVIESGQWWWAPVLVLGGLLTAGYVFALVGFAFRPREGEAVQQPIPKSLEIAALGLALASIIVGFRAEEFLQVLSVGLPFETTVEGWEEEP
jgi:multicomponent Na+:H+ antiporter subunit D